MSNRVFLTLTVACLLAGILNGRAEAQRASSVSELDAHQLLQRLEDQDQRIRELESLIDRAERPVQTVPAAIESSNDAIERTGAIEPMHSRSEDYDLFKDAQSVDTHDEKWTRKWNGRIMGDYVNWLDQTPRVGGQDYFEFRRIRLSLSGEGYGVYDYRFQVEFEPESMFDINGSTLVTDGVGIRDMTIGIKDVPMLGYVLLGHFKTPFSLEWQTSSKYLMFMERGLPNALAPARAVGIAAFNQSADEYATWGAGVFFDGVNDIVKQRVDDNQGVRVIGRATWLPYYDEPSGGRYLVHTGISAQYVNDRDQSIAFGSRPEIHEGPLLVFTGEVNATDYTTVDAAFSWVNGPFAMQSELMWTNVNAISAPNQNYYGAYAYISYFLTGENRSYDRKWARFERVTPLENFWVVNTPGGKCCGRGAWEVAARWSYIDLSEGPDNEQLNDLTVGVNWYWNSHARMMINWIHAFTDGPSGQGNADILGMRWQVDY